MSSVNVYKQNIVYIRRVAFDWRNVPSPPEAIHEVKMSSRKARLSPERYTAHPTGVGDKLVRTRALATKALAYPAPTSWVIRTCRRSGQCFQWDRLISPTIKRPPTQQIIAQSKDSNVQIQHSTERLGYQSAVLLFQDPLVRTASLVT